ncbi:phosphopantetheine-binding protein [Streptomyces roseicoloratus]|uniref:Phosphopantetheine-binding protein n=1 Tax=Streptomyces roseicoloratus TaxID=2508722 RepID=A0ABY9RXQ1_9ACTN|nr:phosphopantetheine-binding protein [Streptomyces roseicoloratus]WMX46962.1 phosphopantetheine-binding protein [Streptomyces roseicoloratus]
MTENHGVREVEYEQPTNELEEEIAAVMAEVLSVDRVGQRDSFYDLGGTSLSAIRICARIERRLGLRVDPLWLLDHDELADFAEQIRLGAE